MAGHTEIDFYLKGEKKSVCKIKKAERDAAELPSKFISVVSIFFLDI